MLLGWKSAPHFGPFHLLSFVFIGGGFMLMAAAWRVLYAAQQERELATSGEAETSLKPLSSFPAPHFVSTAYFK